MNFKADIISRIESDFNEKTEEVLSILKNAIDKTEYLNHDRILRCIIFLSEKNVDNLKRFIEVATIDPRDVMFWAEYINRDANRNPKRIRDFNKTFDQCEVDVRE